MKSRGIPDEPKRFAEFEFDLRRGELRKHGIRIRVQEQPLKVLAALLEHPGEVVTREELQKRLWGGGTFVEFEHGLNAAVNRLREALCDSAETPRYVETVARRGYRFIAEVEVSRPLDTDASRPPKWPRWAIWGTGTLALAAIAVFGLWMKARSIRMEPMKVVPLTTNLGTELMPSFSPDGRQVAFAWTGENNDNADVYVKIVGSAAIPLRLTTDAAEDINPVWSPDGSQIAFVRKLGNQSSVCLISPLGGGERKLAGFQNSAIAGLAWAPNGKVLAAAGAEPHGTNGIFALQIENGEKWRLSSNPHFQDRHPAFSPDGRFLAYTSSTGLYSSDILLQPLQTDFRPQGQPSRVTNQGFTNLGITWAADGRSLIYSASREGATNYHLYRLSVSGSDQPQQLAVAGVGAIHPAVSAAGNRLAFARSGFDIDIMKWRTGEVPRPFISSTMIESQPGYSPDGSRIVFTSKRGGDGHAIWICNQDGSDLVQLTNRFSRYEGSPYWSPDGRYVVFDAQGKDGHWDVYRIPSDGGKPEKLTATGSDNASPVYSRDGKWIYLSSNRSGESEIWRMAASGGAAVQLTRGGGYYAVESWDGKTLYYNGSGFTNNTISPLMEKSLAGGAERRILDAVYSRRFVPVEKGIYYVGPALADGKYRLLFLDFATGSSKLLTTFDSPPAIGLTVSPDQRTILFAVVKRTSPDLMMIENFR